MTEQQQLCWLNDRELDDQRKAKLAANHNRRELERILAMTEQQQRAASAELAQRMGWTLVHHGYGVSPDEFTPPQPRAVPDYFTDAAASRELMLWLAKQDHSIQREFVFALREATNEVDLCYELRLLTAPLPIIARAACKALGIEVSE